MKTTIESVIELKDLCTTEDYEKWKDSILEKVTEFVKEICNLNDFEVYRIKGIHSKIITTSEIQKEVRKELDNVSYVFSNMPIEKGRECLKYEISLDDAYKRSISIDDFISKQISITVLNSQRGGGTATGLFSLKFFCANTKAIKTTLKKKLNSFDFSVNQIEEIEEIMEEELICNYSFERLIDIQQQEIIEYIRSINCLEPETLFDKIVSNVDNVIEELLYVEQQDNFRVFYNNQKLLKIKQIKTYEIEY